MAGFTKRLAVYFKTEFAPEKLKWERIVTDEKRGRCCPSCSRFGFYIHLPTSIREYWWGFYRCKGCKQEYRPAFTKGNLLFLSLMAFFYFNYFGQRGFTYWSYLNMVIVFAFALGVNFIYSRLSRTGQKLLCFLLGLGGILAFAQVAWAHHGEGVANLNPKDILYLTGSTIGFTLTAGSLIGLFPGVQPSIEDLLDFLLRDESEPWVDREPLRELVRSELPPLVNPKTGETLLVNDGTYEGGRPGQIWYEEGWMDRGEVERRISQWETEYERDRRKWFDEHEKDWEQRLRENRESQAREGLVRYDAEQDAWVPGENATEVEEARRKEQLEAIRRLIRGKENDVLRQEFLEDLADRVDGQGGDLDRLRRAMLDQLWHAERMKDSAQHLDFADYMKAGEDSAKTTRDWSRRVNRLLARVAPGAGRLVTRGQSVLYGVVDGYSEGGGITGALTAAASEAADDVIDKYTGLDNIGQTFRNQYYCASCGIPLPPLVTLCAQCGFKRGGGTVLERFVKDAAYEQVKRYDPEHYKERFKKATGPGDYLDIFSDIYDSTKGAYTKVKGGYEAARRADDPHHYTKDEDLPRIRGPVPDAPDSPRQRSIGADDTSESPAARLPRGTAVEGEESDAIQSRTKPGEAGDRHRIGAPDDGTGKGTPPPGSEKDADGAYVLKDPSTKGVKIWKPGDHMVPMVEGGDCTVATIAKATGKSYEEVEANIRHLRNEDGTLPSDKFSHAIEVLSGGKPERVQDLPSDMMKRLNRGDSIIADMRNPDGSGHAVVIDKIKIQEVEGPKGKQRQYVIEYIDPAQGRVEKTMSELQQEGTLDWKNMYYNRREGASPEPTAADRGTELPHKIGRPVDQKPAPPTPRERGDIVEKDVAPHIAEQRGESKLYDKGRSDVGKSGHGPDNIYEKPDPESGRGLIILEEDKAGKAREDYKFVDRLGDDGKPIIDKKTGEPKKSRYFQTSTEKIKEWTKAMEQGSEHDKEVAAKVKTAMEEGRLRVRLTRGHFDKDGNLTRVTWETGRPQPGVTTHYQEQGEWKVGEDFQYPTPKLEGESESMASFAEGHAGTKVKPPESSPFKETSESAVTRIPPDGKPPAQPSAPDTPVRPGYSGPAPERPPAQPQFQESPPDFTIAADAERVAVSGQPERGVAMLEAHADTVGRTATERLSQRSEAFTSQIRSFTLSSQGLEKEAAMRLETGGLSRETLESAVPGKTAGFTGETETFESRLQSLRTHSGSFRVRSKPDTEG